MNFTVTKTHRRFEDEVMLGILEINLLELFNQPEEFQKFEEFINEKMDDAQIHTLSVSVIKHYDPHMNKRMYDVFRKFFSVQRNIKRVRVHADFEYDVMDISVGEKGVSFQPCMFLCDDSKLEELEFDVRHLFFVTSAMRFDCIKRVYITEKHNALTWFMPEDDHSTKRTTPLTVCFYDVKMSSDYATTIIRNTPGSDNTLEITHTTFDKYENTFADALEASTFTKIVFSDMSPLKVNFFLSRVALAPCVKHLVLTNLFFCAWRSEDALPLLKACKSVEKLTINNTVWNLLPDITLENQLGDYFKSCEFSDNTFIPVVIDNQPSSSQQPESSSSSQIPKKHSPSRPCENNTKRSRSQ